MTYAKLLLTIGILVVLANEGQMADWLSGLNENLNKLNSQIQQSVQNLQRDIQTNVQHSLANVDRITARVNENIKNVKEGIEKGEYSTINSNGGVVVMNSPGVSRTITSGNLPNGSPYWYDVEDKVIGRYLFHTERFYNDTTNGIQVVAYKVNLDDPKAEPVPINTGT